MFRFDFFHVSILFFDTNLFVRKNQIFSQLLTSSSISLSPRSSLSSFVSDASDGGSSLSRFSLSSSDVSDVSRPKSAGNDVSDISLRPSTLSERSWLNAGGSRGMGFELKSAICRERNAPILSGMSGMSATEDVVV